MSGLISIPPLFGWKADLGPNECAVSQAIGYQFYATFGAFYLPLLVMVVIYYRIYMVSSRLADAEARSKPFMVNGGVDVTRQRLAVPSTPIKIKTSQTPDVDDFEKKPPKCDVTVVVEPSTETPKASPNGGSKRDAPTSPRSSPGRCLVDALRRRRGCNGTSSAGTTSPSAAAVQGEVDSDGGLTAGVREAVAAAASSRESSGMIDLL